MLLLALTRSTRSQLRTAAMRLVTRTLIVQVQFLRPGLAHYVGAYFETFPRT